MKTLQEDLRDWFSPTHPKGGWKRINSKGEAIGPCAREPGDPKPKCMSNAKRASLTKNQRASAVRTKRKHDPNPERKGQPIMVSNYGKGKISEEYEIDAANGLIESMDLLLEKNKPTSPDKWQDCISQAKAKFDIFPSAYSNGWAVQCYKRKGGKWKSVNEDKRVFSEFLNKDSILRQIKEGKTKKVNKQKSRDWKDEQFLKGLESGKRISELLGGRKLTTADGKPARMGYEEWDPSALEEMAQTPARRKQIVDKQGDLLRQANALTPEPYASISSNALSGLDKLRLGFLRQHTNLEKVGKRERASGWTYDIDGKKLRLGKKAKKGSMKEAVDKESMPCNKPRASTSPGKKKMVKACEGGQEKIIHYGAKGYGHNYSPAARKSFRARHSCSERKTKLGAQHWACKDLWAGKGGSTKSCPEGRKCKY
jgi:hypothetical protein